MNRFCAIILLGITLLTGRGLRRSSFVWNQNWATTAGARRACPSRKTRAGLRMG